MSSRPPLGIAVSCFATYGGSGVIAAEIGMEMARRGHRVHFIGNEIPRRLDQFHDNIFFHEVEIRDYPVFVAPPYALSLASKIVEVCNYESIDLLHVHYAIPHATSAYLARQVLKEKAPKIITTLHGTDITLVGTDRSYLPITRFSIVESDAITAPSQYLRNATYDKLNVPSTMPIEVISNFVDTKRFQPCASDSTNSVQRLFKCNDTERVLVHTSNFRPLKRVGDVVRIFAGVQAEIPARLVLIGDGPERSHAESVARELGVLEKIRFLGKLESFTPILAESDLFLLPSDTESFGLAALEAMSCGVPVIASRVGGIPEVVLHNETGFLAEVGDVEAMIGYAKQVLRDDALMNRLSEGARARAVKQFDAQAVLDKYENYYYRILETPRE